MNKKIFICEDNIHVLNAIMDVLSVTGAELIAELDSTRALERMITIRPDVLICDIEMPIVSGSELIRLIRKSEILNNVFVLGISASHNGKEASMLAGANAFIEKPFDICDFMAALPF
ncbi:response regulator [Sphingobacterium sp. NPDC055431]